MKTISEPVNLACETVGGQAALARLVGAPPAFVFQWLNNKRPVPARYCLAIENATNGKVTRKDLNPDWHLIWPELCDSKVTEAA